MVEKSNMGRAAVIPQPLDPPALWGDPSHSPTSNSAPSPSDKPCQIIVSKYISLKCQNSCTMLKLTLSNLFHFLYREILINFNQGFQCVRIWWLLNVCRVSLIAFVAFVALMASVIANMRRNTFEFIHCSKTFSCFTAKAIISFVQCGIQGSLIFVILLEQ